MVTVPDEGQSVSEPEAGTSWSFDERLPYDSTAPGVARRLVRDLLHRSGNSSNQVVDSGELVVHELVINGLTHGLPDGHHRIDVSGKLTEDHLVISVRDAGRAGTVAALPPTEDRAGGRGLAMVAALSSSWTVDRTRGTRVSAWLEL